MERYQEVIVALSKSVKKKSPEAPPGGEITMTSYPACNYRYFANHAFQIKKVAIEVMKQLLIQKTYQIIIIIIIIIKHLYSAINP